MNIKFILVLCFVGSVWAGQLSPVYSPVRNIFRYSAYDFPEVSIDVDKEKILLVSAGQWEIRLTKRPDFDFDFPLKATPDVRALQTPDGVCMSVYFERASESGFYVYVFGGEVWIYNPAQSGGWMHWATGEKSTRAPEPIGKVFDFLKGGASVSRDPFAATQTESLAEDRRKADGVVPIVTSPSPETPAPR